MDTLFKWAFGVVLLFVSVSTIQTLRLAWNDVASMMTLTEALLSWPVLVTLLAGGAGTGAAKRLNTLWWQGDPPPKVKEHDAAGGVTG